MRPSANSRRLSTILGFALPVAAALALTTPARAAAAETAPEASTTTTPFDSKVLRNINRVREARDLHRVRSSDCLDGLAEPWARHLAEIGSLVHRDQAVVLSRCSMDWAGENLGSGSSLTARGLVRAWMDSPAHRKVLLKPRARRGAVGAASDSDGQRYVVLNLGDPS